MLRLHTRTELKKLYQTLRQTVVFVTHDQEEALTLGTRIALLHQGKLLQYDSPRTIYREPASRFVAELRPGSPLGLKLPAAALHFFDAATGERLP